MPFPAVSSWAVQPEYPRCGGVPWGVGLSCGPHRSGRPTLPSDARRWCISRHHCPTACSSSTSSGASRSMEPPTASCTCSLPRYGLKREVPKGAPHSSCHLPGQVGRGKDGEWANAVPREADVSPPGCGGSVEYLQSLDHLLSQVVPTPC